MAFFIFEAMKKLIFGWLFLLGPLLSQAAKVYEFNSVCQQAYHEITRLKIANGQALIAKAKQQNPDNLIPVLLESYIDFFVLFLNEDPAEYKIRKPHFDERIAQLKEGPASSPFYLFCLSEAHMQRAATAIKFGDMWNGAWEFRKAWQMIKDNKKAFPTFTPNDLLYGSIQAALGTIPKGYKWIANIFGFKGSVTEGMKTIRGFVYSSDPWARMMNVEGSFVYCYLQFYIENKKDETIQFIQYRKLDVVNNHLLAYMAANLSKNNKQVEYAKSIILNKNNSPEYLATPVWDFEMGFDRMYHLELPEAIRHFERYVSNFKGTYYVKDVYQKLSWCYLLEGNMQAAQNARNAILKKGAINADADKQALKEAKSGTWPDPFLLRVRLLSDGGYNREALQLINTKSIGEIKEQDRLEYIYRLGRIYDDLNNDEQAIHYYQSAIQLGEHSTEYYAARAALQTGMIYEHRGDRARAISYYQKCLNMEDHDYKNSLDQRAKSGIARCKGE